MRTPAVALVLSLAVAACGGDAPAPTAAVDPDRFGGPVDNPWLPLAPGTTMTYETDTADGLQRTVVTVTGDTREILGVDCLVVRDTVTLDGELVEDTYDWFAEDDGGNVWYFGEDTKDYEGGRVVGTEGSWEAGVDGAEPGIVMEADPAVGDAYRQEHYAGHAEDEAEVVGLDGTVTVPYGSWRDVLVTEDTTPLEPGLVEHKHYARGVGLVLAVDLRTGEREELVSVEGP